MERLRNLAPACGPAAACIACLDEQDYSLDPELAIHDADLAGYALVNRPKEWGR